HPLPPIASSMRIARIRYLWLSFYRRLMLIVLVINIIAISALVGKEARHRGSFGYNQAATAVGANLSIAVLMRQEHVINLLFRIALLLPHSTPLQIRRLAAKLTYNNGGVHSGAAISALLWYVFFSVLVVRQWVGPPIMLRAVVALTAVLLASFVTIVGMSHPAVRRAYHNQWELTHRFGGWTAIALVWAQFLILAVVGANAGHTSLGLALIQQPNFWFLIIITCCLIYPWLRTKRLSFEAKQLSTHATQLHFNDRKLLTCRGVRLAHNPLLECHGFATIPDTDTDKGYSVVISNAGDFTRKMIDSPPKHIWIRGAPTTGVMRVSSMFHPLVVVATGSGIGPCLSWLNMHHGYPVRVIWSARSPETTYQSTMIRDVLRADPQALIIDTKQTGTPDLVALVYSLVKQSGAEAITIIANPKVTQDVVFGMEARKIAAFGAIFDS
ncbi:hypothetical protein BAUCODRAFT_48961, partial [Baudoinia panamericana UAMH 10762]